MSNIVTRTYVLGDGGFHLNPAQLLELQRLSVKVANLGPARGAGAEIYDYLLSLISTKVLVPHVAEDGTTTEIEIRSRNAGAA